MNVGAGCRGGGGGDDFGGLGKGREHVISQPSGKERNLGVRGAGDKGLVLHATHS